MAAPTATATFNKASYAPGEVMVLTIDHSDTDRRLMPIAGTVTDTTGESGTFAATAVIDEGTVTWTDTGGKTWTLVSATLNQSVFQTTA